jgi:hypothetical protein
MRNNSAAQWNVSANNNSVAMMPPGDLEPNTASGWMGVKRETQELFRARKGGGASLDADQASEPKRSGTSESCSILSLYLREISAEVGLPAVKVRKLRAAVQAPLSLDGGLEQNDGRCLAEAVADESVPTAFEALEARGQADLLREFLPQLSEREREVLRLRHGLDGESERTLDEGRLDARLDPRAHPPDPKPGAPAAPLDDGGTRRGPARRLTVRPPL